MNQLLTLSTHTEFSTIEGFTKNLLKSPYCGSSVETSNWTKDTIQSWNEYIFESFRRPSYILKLGLRSVFKGLRKITFILLLRLSFSSGLMKFGVFKSRG